MDELLILEGREMLSQTNIVELNSIHNSNFCMLWYIHKEHVIETVIEHFLFSFFFFVLELWFD